MYIEAIERNVDIVDEDLTLEFFGSIGNTVAIDIETSGLDPKVDKIATVQVYNPGGNIEIVRIHEGQEVPRVLINLLEDEHITKIFHYAPFDVSFLMHHMYAMPRNIKDTRVLATILDPHRERFWNPTREAFDHGLAALVYNYYGVTLDKSIAVSNWFGELEPRQVEYAARDVLYLPDLVNKLSSELRPHQREVAELAFQWIPAKVYFKLHNLPDPTGRV